MADTVRPPVAEPIPLPWQPPGVLHTPDGVQLHGRRLCESVASYLLPAIRALQESDYWLLGNEMADQLATFRTRLLTVGDALL